VTRAQHSRLSLRDFALDKALCRRLPRGLATYYLALPVAIEDNTISVVMAHPDDRRALGVLRSVLHASIAPIYGSAEEIRSALDAVWRDEETRDSQLVLCLGSAAGSGTKMAGILAESLSAQVTFLDANLNNIETALTVAREGKYNLTALEVADGQSIARLARDSSTSLLLVQGNHTPMKKILLVLRGHSPDDSALNWLIPLGQTVEASITLLAVMPSILPAYAHGAEKLQGLAMLLSNDNEAGDHVLDCVRRVRDAGLEGFLKLRQGILEAEIADEVAGGDYDLIAIAAEAHGEFVQQVLLELESRKLHEGRPILVLKPRIP